MHAHVHVHVVDMCMLCIQRLVCPCMLCMVDMCMHTYMSYMYCDRAASGVAYTRKEVCTRTAGGRWCG